jgi:hypothetical protein
MRRDDGRADGGAAAAEPLGQQALEGARGDLVRVSDGHASVYMFPGDIDADGLLVMVRGTPGSPTRPTR